MQTPTDISFKRRYSTTAAGWNILQSIPRGGSSIAVDDGSEDMSESEEDELSSDLSEDSELEESEDDSTPSTSTSNGPPIKLTIKTNLASTLIDQKLDFTASRTRTIASIKLAISKSMIGRPPLSSTILKYHGRTLHDEECVFDLLEDLDSDDEEEEDSDAEDNIGEEEDEDTIKLTLTADILPPIDTKFGIELKEKLHKLSTQEILDAYCVNMAGMVYGQELFVKESELYESNENDEGLDEELEELHTSSTSSNENHSLNIRKKAALIQSQFESTLTSETKQLLQEEHTRVKQHLSSYSSSSTSDDSDEIIYGLISQNEINSSSSRKGRRRTLKGGASMNVKRSLQRNLNVVRIVLV